MVPCFPVLRFPPLHFGPSFSTPFKTVPRFPVPRFPPLHFWWSRVFQSRVFSRPLSAGCECRLFGTGLVMSQSASDYTQNAAFRDRKLNNFLGKGHSPLHGPLPKPHTPRRLRRSSFCPSTFIICPPPISHFWLRAWLLSRSRFVCCLPLSNSLTVFSVFEVIFIVLCMYRETDGDKDWSW